MRAPFLAFGVVFLLAGASAQNITAVLASLPQCSLPCLLDGISTFNCSLSSLAPCFCGSVPLQSDLSTCLQQSCSFDDQTRAAEVGDELCAGMPKPSRANVVRRDTIILAAVTYPIVIIRFFQRWSVAHQFWWDDGAAAIATIFLAAVNGMELASTNLGFGSHYWNVPVSNGTALLQLFWIIQIFYIVVQVFAKLSICLLYLRIFPRPRFQLFTKLTIAFVLSHATAFIFAIVFQCHPISSIWDRRITGHCINLSAVGFAGAAASIFEDVLILVLPISELNTLNLGTKKKLSLIFMFSIGSFACVTSMVRLKYLTQFGRSFDLTWDNVDVLIWSSIELHTALICACLPSVRSLLVKFFPDVFRSTVATSKATPRRASYPMRNLRQMGGQIGPYVGLPDVLETKSTTANKEKLPDLGVDTRKSTWEVTITGGEENRG
ncbi:integral membrane protein [Xylogone sp. PMI_703]|nr:integral membrane protein [Xylogone sp. PMI_703]